MTNMSYTQLELWDYVSMSCLVILSSIIGLYHIFTAKKSKETKDFLVSSKDLGLLPLILSTMATFFSAIGMLGFPIEFYMNGLSFATIIVPMLLNAPIAMYLYLPVFFKLNKNTIFEYLELRFCRSIRICTSLILTIQTIFYTSVVMYAPALALSQVTGLHLWASVVSIAIVCIIYTSLGGFRAVVWADVTQCVVMIIVLLIIIIRGITDVGGFPEIWERLRLGKRDEIPVWHWSEHTQYSLWTIIIANPIHLTGFAVLNQVFMQRYLSRNTLKQSQILLAGGAISIAIGQALIVLVGLALYANYYNCDPLLSGKVKHRDQIMALFAVESLSFCKGLPGIFVAGVMCATLSTLSSTLNSLTAVTLSDYIKVIKPDLSEATSFKLSKALVVIYGGVCIALVALAENMEGIAATAFAISGLTGGPVTTVFTVGMLLPWVNSNGAKVAFFSSMTFPFWAYFGKMVTSPLIPHAPISIEGCHNVTLALNVTSIVKEKGLLDDFYTTHSFWYTIWSLTVGITSALIFTKITGSYRTTDVDPNLLFPFMRKYTAKKSGDLSQMNEVNGHVVEPLLICNQQKDT